MPNDRELRIAVIGVPGGWSSERLADAVARRTGFRLLVDWEQVAFDLDRGRVTVGGIDLRGVSGVIVKKASREYSQDARDRLRMLWYLGECGVRVFSNPTAILRVFDRLSCTTVLRLGGIPMPPTVLAQNVDDAHATLKTFGSAFFKPLYTSKARGMKIIHDGAEARGEIEAFRAAGNRLMYIQQKLDLPGRDLGITFLGGEYVATYARVAKADSWNTTTHHGGTYQPHEPAPQVIEVARRAQALFDLDFTCVDVAETAAGPVVFEVSAFGGFRGLLESHGIEIAERYADYVVRKLTRG